MWHQAAAKTASSVLETATTFRPQRLPLYRWPVITRRVPPSNLHPRADHLVPKAQAAAACGRRALGHDAWFHSAAPPAGSGVSDDRLLVGKSPVHMHPAQKAAIDGGIHTSFMQAAMDAYRIVIAEQIGFHGSGKQCSHGGVGQAMHGHRRRAWRPNRIIERASSAFPTLPPFRSCAVFHGMRVALERCAKLPPLGRPACE